MATRGGRKAVAKKPARARKATASAASGKRRGEVRRPARPADGKVLVAEVRALERLLAKRLDLEVARVEVGGIRYVAFSARPQKVARELRKVKSDKAPIYFVGGGRVDWRSRVPFRVVFREPPMAGGREVAFQSEREGRLHRLSLDVGGFGTPKTLDYDIYFDGSTVPHDPSIIIDPNFLYLKPE